MKNLFAALAVCLSISAFAQGKPAYSVAEIEFVNKEVYQKELWPKIQRLVRDSGAEIIAASNQVEGISGNSKMPNKVTVIKFKSLPQAKAFYASKSYQELKPLAESSVKIKLYIIEGE